MSKYIIGSARHDEDGNYHGGKEGDQTGHEVEFQEFYVHSKNWYVLRCKDVAKAAKIAQNMIDACNNPNVGYNQDEREQIYDKGVHSTTPCNCDCSTLVSECVQEADIKVGDFYTGDEADVLVATGMFTKIPYTDGMTLMLGDILVTRTKGHTAIVTEAPAPTIKKGYKDSEKSGNFCEQMQVMLNELGFTDDNGEKLVADGSCGSKSVQAILKLQSMLKSSGFYTGEIDGSFGPGTRAALEKYLAAAVKSEPIEEVPIEKPADIPTEKPASQEFTLKEDFFLPKGTIIILP